MRFVNCSFKKRANPAVQGTLRDKASRSAPDLERWASHHIALAL